MDWTAAVLSLLIVAFLWWQVARWLKQARDVGYVRGWNEGTRAEQARQARQQSQQ